MYIGGCSGELPRRPIVHSLRIFTTVFHAWRRRNKRRRGLGRRRWQIQVAIVRREKPERRTPGWHPSSEIRSRTESAFQMGGILWIATYAREVSKETPTLNHPAFSIQYPESTMSMIMSTRLNKESRVATGPFLPNVPRFHRV